MKNYLCNGGQSITELRRTADEMENKVAQQKV